MAYIIAKVNLVLNAGNLPWVNILHICAKYGIFINNYPEDVPVPGGKENGGRNKGVGNISKQERLLIIQALHAAKNPMQFVKARNPAGTEEHG